MNNKENKENGVYINRETIQFINCNKALSFKSNANIESIKIKSKLLGINVTGVKDNLYILDNNNKIIVASDLQLKIRYVIELFSKTKFKSIDLSELDTSEMTCTDSMFYKCEAESINFRNFDTSNVIDMSNMFLQCKVSSLDLRNFNTSKVESMESMFGNCEANSINVGSFDTSNVADMDNMFFNCKLKNLDLSNFDTSKVETMNSMFEGLKTKELDLRHFDTSNVKEMASMFYSCKLENNKLDLSNFNTNKLNKTTYMFSDTDLIVTTNDEKLLHALDNK